MSLKIVKVSNGMYLAIATPPDVDEAWETRSPLAKRELIDELRCRGAHQTDIGDAFYTADPNWLNE